MVNFNIIRASKILLLILSWGPLIYTVLILLSYSVTLPFMDIILLASLLYLIYGGPFVWLLLNSVLTWKKVITKRQCVYNILLTSFGLLWAYLLCTKNV